MEGGGCHVPAQVIGSHPALLAANRANALRSTGPCTHQGKARVALNPLPHGRYARHLRPKLAQAGDPAGDRQYRWFHAEVARAFGVSTPEDRRQAEPYAAQAWCLTRRVAGAGSPGPGPKGQIMNHRSRNVPWNQWLSSTPLVQLRIAIVDRRRRIGLVFWLRRRRYWTLERLVRVLRSEERLRIPAPDWELEQRWRRFRPRKPGLWEQLKLEEISSEQESNGRGRCLEQSPNTPWNQQIAVLFSHCRLAPGPASRRQRLNLNSWVQTAHDM